MTAVLALPASTTADRSAGPAGSVGDEPAVTTSSAAPPAGTVLVCRDDDMAVTVTYPSRQGVVAW